LRSVKHLIGPSRQTEQK